MPPPPSLGWIASAILVRYDQKLGREPSVPGLCAAKTRTADSNRSQRVADLESRRQVAPTGRSAARTRSGAAAGLGVGRCGLIQFWASTVSNRFHLRHGLSRRAGRAPRLPWDPGNLAPPAPTRSSRPIANGAAKTAVALETRGKSSCWTRRGPMPPLLL